MNNNNIDVWVLHSKSRILVTDLPGVPADVVVASGGTVGDTVFRREDHRAFSDWSEARGYAAAVAAELRYDISFEAMS